MVPSDRAPSPFQFCNMSSEIEVGPFGQAQELASVLTCILHMQSGHSPSSTIPSEEYTSIDASSLLSHEQLEKYAELFSIANLANCSSSLELSQGQEAVNTAADAIHSSSGAGMAWAHALSNRVVASTEKEGNRCLISQDLPELPHSEMLPVDSYSSCTETDFLEVFDEQSDDEISVFDSADTEHLPAAPSSNFLIENSSTVDSISEFLRYNGSCNLSPDTNNLPILEDDGMRTVSQTNNLSSSVSFSSSRVSQKSSILGAASSMSCSKDPYHEFPEFFHCSDSTKTLDEISYSGSETASHDARQKEEKHNNCNMEPLASVNVTSQATYAPYAIDHPSMFTSIGSTVDPYTISYSKTAHMQKEMMYQIAAFQPVLDIDTEGISRPKRKNVRISKDPQSVAARHRRQRISDRIRILQRLVPGGLKMDTASMLDEAAQYIKFLKMQVQALDSLTNSLGCLNIPYTFPTSPSTMDHAHICTEGTEIKQHSRH